MWTRTITLAVLIGVGCRADWTTEMWYQPSIGPEQSPRPEPEHAVPLGAGPELADRDAAESLHNPIPADAASLGRGAVLFAERCIACHGKEGHGGGPVSKFFPPAPDLAYATIRVRSDGYIFGTIVFGGRAMPPGGAGLSARERWDLVNEVRFLQGLVPGGGR